MIIDMHCHLAPPKWAEAKPIPPLLTDVEGFFRRKEQAGISIAVISNPMMNVPGTQQNDLTLDKIREYEDFATNIMSQYPGRVYAFLGVNPFGDSTIFSEIEHAIKKGDFKGLTINSSVNGEFLDSPQTDEFWSLVASLDVPVFVHPPALPIGHTGVKDFRLVEHVGRPCDVALGLAAIIFSGVLERYPSLKLIGGMAGGGLSMLPGRLDMGYRYAHWQRAQTPEDPTGQVTPPPFVPKSIGQAKDMLTQNPSTFFQHVYVDSCTYSTPAMLCNLAVYGREHVLFGTDSPPVGLPMEEAVRQVKSLPIEEEDKEYILWKNAAQLLKLEGLPND